MDGWHLLGRGKRAKGIIYHQLDLLYAVRWYWRVAKAVQMTREGVISNVRLSLRLGLCDVLFYATNFLGWCVGAILFRPSIHPSIHPYLGSHLSGLKKSPAEICNRGFHFFFHFPMWSSFSRLTVLYCTILYVYIYLPFIPRTRVTIVTFTIFPSPYQNRT